ncbi:MAG: YIP1 family protein [Melioribacteraceae bacterium]
MKNVLVCNNCNKENAFYLMICSNCNSFLRSKLPNIDLWETIGKLIESPLQAFDRIIQAENKNYVVTLMILVCVKLSLAAIIIHNALYSVNGVPITFLNGLLLGGLPSIVLLSVFSLIITYINKLFGIGNRFKDNFAIYIFGFIPLIGGMVVLTPIQFALFGEYWFTFNPSPLLMKPTPSLILLIIEGLLFVWSSVLFIVGTYSQTRNKIYSICTGVILTLLVMGVIYFRNLVSCF